jgi:hypothetical protein
LASFSPRLLLDDTTSERVAALLQASGEQLALISPDAGDVAQNLLGKYRKGNNTDEYLYLKAFEITGRRKAISRDLDTPKGPKEVVSQVLSWFWQ